MKHLVTVAGNEESYRFEGCTKNEAVKIAKRESIDGNRIYISADNGQCTVYLNPNGNYEPTGKTW